MHTIQNTQAKEVSNRRTKFTKQRLSLQQWRTIINDYHQSGLSQKAYCERNHISLNQFGYRKKLLIQGKQTTADCKVRIEKNMRNSNLF